MAFWGSPSNQPHSWHEELWATIESRVLEGLLRGGSPPTGGRGEVGTISGDKSTPQQPTPSAGAESSATAVATTATEVSVDKARALASEEWNKARAVAATSEVFKAMSRTGAGGDAYFCLVALFCTADKLVVPVHCEESPVKVEFLSRESTDARDGRGRGKTQDHPAVGGASSSRPAGAKKKASPRGARGGEDVHVVVTVPSTFDIYLRDGATSKSKGDAQNRGGGGGGGGAGGGKMQHNSPSRSSSGGRGGAGGGSDVGADASIALHLVRVKAVVEEEIWVVGSTRLPASSSGGGDGSGRGGGPGRGIRRGSAGTGAGGGGRGGANDDDAPPTLRFLLSHPRNDRRASSGSAGEGPGRRHLTEQLRGRGGLAGAGGRRDSGGDGSPSTTPPPPPPAPLLTLTRTERRMRVSVVPEPSAVSEMVRSISRKIGVDVPGPQPPRVLGL